MFLVTKEDISKLEDLIEKEEGHRLLSFHDYVTKVLDLKNPQWATPNYWDMYADQYQEFCKEHNAGFEDLDIFFE